MNNNCVVVVNKEKNYTSRDVVNVLNKIMKTNKMGHTGTLDPIATGVLVVCVGKYTKLVNHLTSLDKEYIATFRVGIKTDTLDTTGKIIATDNKSISNEELKRIIESFKKTYEQTVPIYSAVSINGKRLYDYARNNIDVQLPKRSVTIHNIELLSYKDNFVTIKVHVSKGTYIRSLINDIGESLNTFATMTDLKRISQGKFTIDNSYSLSDIENNNYKVLKIKDLFDVEIVNLDDKYYNKVINGNVIDYPSNKKYVLFMLNEEEKALYEINDNKGKVLLIM